MLYNGKSGVNALKWYIICEALYSYVRCECPKMARASLYVYLCRAFILDVQVCTIHDSHQPSQCWAFTHALANIIMHPYLLYCCRAFTLTAWLWNIHTFSTFRPRTESCRVSVDQLTFDRALTRGSTSRCQVNRGWWRLHTYRELVKWLRRRGFTHL